MVSINRWQIRSEGDSMWFARINSFPWLSLSRPHDSLHKGTCVISNKCGESSDLCSHRRYWCKLEYRLIWWLIWTLITLVRFCWLGAVKWGSAGDCAFYLSPSFDVVTTLIFLEFNCPLFVNRFSNSNCTIMVDLIVCSLFYSCRCLHYVLSS